MPGRDRRIFGTKVPERLSDAAGCGNNIRAQPENQTNDRPRDDVDRKGRKDDIQNAAKNAKTTSNAKIAKTTCERRDRKSRGSAFADIIVRRRSRDAARSHRTPRPARVVRVRPCSRDTATADRVRARRGIARVNPHPCFQHAAAKLQRPDRGFSDRLRTRPPWRAPPPGRSRNKSPARIIHESLARGGAFAQKSLRSTPYPTAHSPRRGGPGAVAIARKTLRRPATGRGDGGPHAAFHRR
jgi:hypothetical protein